MVQAGSYTAVAVWWFDSGTPTFLIRQMQHFRTDITALDSMEAPATAFDKPTEAMPSALPLLYQSGYLTIKDYDRDTAAYTLGIPNQEVRIGYTEGLLPTYIGLDSADVVVFMPDAIYVIELKMNGTAQEALQQIEDKGYARPYGQDGHRIVRIGVNFSIVSKSIDDWIISEEQNGK